MTKKMEDQNKASNSTERLADSVCCAPVLSRKDLIAIGFKELPHMTIMNSITYDLGRNRILSIGCLSEPNEMMWICEVAPDGKQINDLVCIHNFDYDGYLTMDKIQMLIKCIGVS